jgi:hypothetical protein
MLNVKMLRVIVLSDVMLNVVKPGALLFSKIADVGNNDVVCSAIACVNATFNSLFIERKQKLLNICSNKLATYCFHCRQAIQADIKMADKMRRDIQHNDTQHNDTQHNIN